MRTAHSQNAQEPPAGGVPKSGGAAILYGLFGILIAYMVALALGLAANSSIQKFEAVMNIAAITGFVLVCAVSARRTATGAVPDNAGRARTSAAKRRRMTSEKATQPSAERWGSAAIIGFLHD